jgi:hypothetical protein
MTPFCFSVDNNILGFSDESTFQVSKELDVAGRQTVILISITQGLYQRKIL